MFSGPPPFHLMEDDPVFEIPDGSDRDTAPDSFSEGAPSVHGADASTVRPAACPVAPNGPSARPLTQQTPAGHQEPEALVPGHMRLSDRLAAMSPGRKSPSGAPEPTTPQRSAQPVRTVGSAHDRQAVEDPEFIRAWGGWCNALYQKTGEYLDPDLTDRVLACSLHHAQKILAAVSSPRIEWPVGLLIWKLRDVESGAADVSAQPRQAQAPAPHRTSSSGAVTQSPLRARPPVQSLLRSSLPLRATVRGEADAMDGDMMHCLGCAVAVPYQRRAARAGGVDQPVGVHRFTKCRCGARISVLEHEHFPESYHVHWARSSQVSTSAQPSTASRPTGRPDDVVPYPAEGLRCLGCGQLLALTVYDATPSMFHNVEYSCPGCQDIYVGMLYHSGKTTTGSFMRRKHSGRASSIG
jgi:hypothetical protein